MTQPQQTLIFGGFTGSAGRWSATEAGVVVNDPGVWTEHLRAERGDSGEITVTDLGSHGGTYIKRSGASQWQRIQPGHPRPLCSGDLIKIGSTIIPYASVQS